MVITLYEMTKQEFISPIYLKNEELKNRTYHNCPESIHHLRASYTIKIKSQIHSIVLAYSLFIDRQDGRRLHDNEPCHCYCTGCWLAELVEGSNPLAVMEVDT